MTDAVRDVCRSGLGPREADAWSGFLRVHATLMKAFDAELQAECGITISEFEVLALLARDPGRRLCMSELAETVLLSASGISRLVERLQRRRLVARETCESDRRGAWAVVTDAGRELIAKAEAVHWPSVRERFLNHFTDEEQELLASFWGRVLEGGPAST